MAASHAQPFRLFDQPPELVIQIMGTDPAATLALIRASFVAEVFFIMNFTAIFNKLLARWPKQLQYLARTILAIRLHLLEPKEYQHLKAKQLLDLYLDPARDAVQIRFPPFSTLNVFCTLTLDIDIASRLFLGRAMKMAETVFNAPHFRDRAAPADILRKEELSRLERAVLRLILFWGLFFKTAGHHPKMRMNWTMPGLPRIFLDRLRRVELEELLTIADNIYHFFRRGEGVSKHFLSAVSQHTLLKGVYNAHAGAHLEGLGEPRILRGTTYLSGGAEYFVEMVGSPDNQLREGYMQRVLRPFGVFLWDRARLASWARLPPPEGLLAPGSVFGTEAFWNSVNWEEGMEELWVSFVAFWE